MLKWLRLSALTLLLDQVSKLAIDRDMQLYQSIELIPGWFNLTYVHNTGAAFSFLESAGGWQRWLFSGLALFISGVLLVWLRGLSRRQVLLAAALALVLGGALGNLIDRIVYGYVIDFLDVYYQSYHWPAFNIADSAICVGVGLMLWDNFFGGSEQDLK